jgi:hypothetical protein
VKFFKVPNRLSKGRAILDLIVQKN